MNFHTHCVILVLFGLFIVSKTEVTNSQVHKTTSIKHIIQQARERESSSSSESKIESHRPIFLMHGLGDNEEAFTRAGSKSLYASLKKHLHPTRKIINIDLFSDEYSESWPLDQGTISGIYKNCFSAKHGDNSLVPLKKQVEGVADFIRETIEKENSTIFDNGYDLICHSQGGLICRGLIALTNHSVSTLISIASPQLGIFGNPLSDTTFRQDSFLGRAAHAFFYSKAVQNCISISNYWHDPDLENGHDEHNLFLPLINGQSSSSSSSIASASVSAGNTNSSSNGLYVVDYERKILNFTETRFYKNDTFGLKTLHRQNKFEYHVVPDVKHMEWLRNEQLFKTYMLPYLQML
eukprot:Awhi_evm1s8297